MNSQPVFLIGAARSGTKFLRDTLSASNEVATIPYDINYVWRHGQESLSHDQLDPASATPARIRHIRQSIVRLARKASVGDETTLIEKSVSNSLRVPFLLAVFPEARFVYLEREGLHVVESALRQWQAPTDKAYLRSKIRYFPVREWRYAIWFGRNLLQRSAAPVWGPRYPGIDQDLAKDGLAITVARQWRHCVERSRATLPDDRTFSIRYSDLANPEGRVSDLVDWLELTDAETVLSELRRTYRAVPDRWPGLIPIEDIDRCRSIIEGVERG